MAIENQPPIGYGGGISEQLYIDLICMIEPMVYDIPVGDVAHDELECACAPNELEGAPDEKDNAPNETEGAPNELEGAPDEKDNAPNETEGAPDEKEGTPDRALEWHTALMDAHRMLTGQFPTPDDASLAAFHGNRYEAETDALCRQRVAYLSRGLHKPREDCEDCDCACKELFSILYALDAHLADVEYSFKDAYPHNANANCPYCNQ
jgi:hypothetical protein